MLPEARILKITFFDVGEGDSILFNCPNGETILIDTGSVLSAVRLAERVREKTRQGLHHLIITHFHADHIGGAFALLPLLCPENLYDNGEPTPSNEGFGDIYRAYLQLRENHPKYRKLTRGDSLELGEVQLSVLSPPAQFLGKDWNANSLVIRVVYGEFLAILMADGIEATDQFLLENEHDLRAKVLKIGHHASGYSSSQALLDAIAPEVAVVSVNEDNFYGYPSTETIERIRSSSGKSFVTSRDGTIALRVSQDGSYSVSEESSV